MQKKKQKSGELAAMFLRLPIDTKARLDAESTRQGVSQARLVTQILDRELVQDDRNAAVENWLDRIA
jgi:predicted DNA-binding protein|tara:strand:+ start:1541 stop:1741 length:201 start_codon:yes stop_codon:yes gene_type:complete